MGGCCWERVGHHGTTGARTTATAAVPRPTPDPCDSISLAAEGCSAVRVLRRHIVEDGWTTESDR